MTIERLVQQFDLDRSAITVGTEGEDNSAGEELAGSDAADGETNVEQRNDAHLNGGIVVTVEVVDDVTAEQVRDAFGEFDAAGIVETDPAGRD